MTGYHVYLTYGRYVYPSPKIVVHENKSINIRKYKQTVQYDMEMEIGSQ